MADINRRGLLAAATAPAAVAASQARPRASSAASAQTQYVVDIRRDGFGVPHISGDTDAAAVFGLAFAQAEDGFDLLEDSIIRALGRGAEIYGEAAFQDDRYVRVLEIPHLARLEFERATPEMRAVYVAYAAGLNHYVGTRRPTMRLLDRFEPWHPLALLRYKYYVLEFLGYAGVNAGAMDRMDAGAERPTGSNAWAVSAAKSTSGRAMLFINPHVGFFGPALYHECHITSGEGLDFYGVGRYGLPLPYMGFNGHLGWGHTDNYPDFGDLYAETFDQVDPLAYRFGDSYRRATRWEEQIVVRRPDGSSETRSVPCLKTHHGPIVDHRDGKPLAVRLAKIEEGGWLDQWRDMAKATSLAAFKSALDRCAIPYMNIVYADREGNIFYAYNGVVPRRSDQRDWSAPVDGSDPLTAWRGYHAFGELPQVLNPASGYVQNCNSSPFVTTPGSGLNPADFPDYMTGPEVDNPRAKVSRAILESQGQFSFDDWTVAATDTRIQVAPAGVAEISAAWNALPPTDPRRERLRPLVEVLVAWNGVMTVDSVAATVFVRWFMRRGAAAASPDAVLAVLAQTRDELEATWGDWRRPWGEVNRLQRIHWSGQGRFDDDAPSWPVRGAPGGLGVVFNFYTGATDGTKRRYGRAGNSFVCVVEFGDTPRARSAMVFGQSQNPDSPHYLDQAEMYADGRFKTALHSAEDIAAHAPRTASFRVPIPAG